MGDALVQSATDQLLHAASSLWAVLEKFSTTTKATIARLAKICRQITTWEKRFPPRRDILYRAQNDKIVLICKMQ